MLQMLKGLGKNPTEEQVSAILAKSRNDLSDAYRVLKVERFAFGCNAGQCSFNGESMGSSSTKR